MQHAATASSVIGIDVCRVLITDLEIRYLASDGEVLPPRRRSGRGEPGAGFVQCRAAAPTALAISPPFGYFPANLLVIVVCAYF